MQQAKGDDAARQWPKNAWPHAQPGPSEVRKPKQEPDAASDAPYHKAELSDTAEGANTSQGAQPGFARPGASGQRRCCWQWTQQELHSSIYWEGFSPKSLVVLKEPGGLQVYFDILDTTVGMLTTDAKASMVAVARSSLE